MSVCAGCTGDVNTAAAPMIVGHPNGDPPRRVEFTLATFGRRAGDRVWITGTEAASLVSFGFAVAL